MAKGERDVRWLMFAIRSSQFAMCESTDLPVNRLIEDIGKCGDVATVFDGEAGLDTIRTIVYSRCENISEREARSVTSA